MRPPTRHAIYARLMSTIRIGFSAALVALALAASAHAKAGTQPVDGFAASVNGRIITVSEVMELVQPLDRKLRDEYSGLELQQKRAEAFEHALDNLIDHALIMEEFKTLGGQLPDRVVKQRAEAVVRDQFKNDRLAFRDALAEERITLDEWRDQIRENLIVNVLRRQEVGDRLMVNPVEVYRLYQERIDQYRVPAQTWLRVIVLPGTVADADSRAAEVRGRLLAGQDFSAVAKEVSTDAKAPQGGDWGWVDVSTLRRELKEAIEKTPAGQLGPAVATPESCYLFRVEERRAAGVKSFEEVRGPLEDELRKRESNRLFDAWMKRLRNKYFVHVYD